MPKSLELTALAFSPWTSSAIIKYCDTQGSRDRDWYWANVKSGMQMIQMHRRIAFCAAVMLAIGQTTTVDDTTMLIFVVTTGSLLAFSLGTLYVQSRKIQKIVEPYLKITFSGAEPILTAQATAERTSAASYGSNSDV
jgi:hypothetical protein